jgi:hypothetical protein
MLSDNYLIELVLLDYFVHGLWMMDVYENENEIIAHVVDNRA